MKVISLKAYNDIRNSEPELALKAEEVADLLEQNGLSYFNHALQVAHVWTGREVEKILNILEKTWPQGKDLKAQDQQFINSYGNLYSMNRRQRKKMLEKKVTPVQRRQLSNLYTRDDMAVIRHNYQIDSISDLTSVQAERLIQNKINILGYVTTNS